MSEGETGGARLTRWPERTLPTEAAILRKLSSEGLQAYSWSNEPGDVYAAHTHHYVKVIYVVRGSIAFGLPSKGVSLEMEAGDRLDLPAGVAHNAVVGPQGVTCLEAHR